MATSDWIRASTPTRTATGTAPHLDAKPVALPDGYWSGDSPPKGHVLSQRSAPAPIRCVGDRDGSGTVVLAELIRDVSIALGTTRLAACPAFDRSGGGDVSVSELTIAVSNALSGCA